MKTNVKVAGTTFHPLPAGVGINIIEECTVDNVPCARVQGVLMPEPTNAYDSEAVAVYIPLKTGAAFCIGYIPAKEPIKTQIQTNTLVEILIKDYGQLGNYSPSFVITEIKM